MSYATNDPTAIVPPLIANVTTLTATVSGWPAVRTRTNPFGGTTFTLGGREIGHVHRSGVVDIAFPRRVRDRLIEAGHTGPHQFYPDSGWTTFRPDGPDAVARASWLLRLSYLYHARAVVRRPSCAAALSELDPGRELAAMDLDPALRAAVFDPIFGTPTSPR